MILYVLLFSLISSAETVSLECEAKGRKFTISQRETIYFSDTGDLLGHLGDTAVQDLMEPNSRAYYSVHFNVWMKNASSGREDKWLKVEKKRNRSASCEKKDRRENDPPPPKGCYVTNMLEEKKYL